MPRNSKQIRQEAERLFPARINVAIPAGGMGRRMAPLHHWLDTTCGGDGWTHSPAGVGGLANDATTYYFRDVTLAAAFVRRWCDGFAEFPGFFKFRDDEPTLGQHAGWDESLYKATRWRARLPAALRNHAEPPRLSLSDLSLKYFEHPMNENLRRRDLVLSACGAGLAAVTRPTLSAAADDWLPPKWRELGFPSTRWANVIFLPTGERFNNIYCHNGEYAFDAVKQFSWICRDYQENEWRWLHPMLLDVIFVLHWKYNKTEIQILSGYRTPETNLLKKYPQRIESKSANLQHHLAKALDLRLPGVDNAHVAVDLARYIFGGVGIYLHDDFIHVDCGPLRQWLR